MSQRTIAIFRQSGLVSRAFGGFLPRFKKAVATLPSGGELQGCETCVEGAAGDELCVLSLLDDAAVV